MNNDCYRFYVYKIFGGFNETYYNCLKYCFGEDYKKDSIKESFHKFELKYGFVLVNEYDTIEEGLLKIKKFTDND